MQRTREIYKVTLIGGAVNVILLLFKFVAGIVGHSAIELHILMDHTPPYVLYV